jgi:hypothetical protein
MWMVQQVQLCCAEQAGAVWHMTHHTMLRLLLLFLLMSLLLLLLLLLLLMMMMWAIRYAHGVYLKKHTVSHSLGLASTFLQEAEGLMTHKRVRRRRARGGCRAAPAFGRSFRGWLVLLDLAHASSFCPCSPYPIQHTMVQLGGRGQALTQGALKEGMMREGVSGGGRCAEKGGKHRNKNPTPYTLKPKTLGTARMCQPVSCLIALTLCDTLACR